jgi:hypothetical protein
MGLRPVTVIVSEQEIDFITGSFLESNQPIDYAHVNTATPGKRWFCTEDEAKAAGWRPAAR